MDEVHCSARKWNGLNMSFNKDYAPSWMHTLHTNDRRKLSNFRRLCGVVDYAAKWELRIRWHYCNVKTIFDRIFGRRRLRKVREGQQLTDDDGKE